MKQLLPVPSSGLIVTPSGYPAALEALQNNWYEASRWSPNRSWVWFPVQDAKHDLDRFTRYELSKHARYLYKNSPLMRGLVERWVTLAVGSGFTPVFRSKKNPKWARRAQAKWNKKARNISLGIKCSFSQYLRAIARVRFLDGEGFSIKTYDLGKYENKVQAVEGDRCTGTATGTEHEVEISATNNIDGIQLNQQGTPVSYKFRGVDTPYPARDVIHHYTPNRPGQYRGETVLAAAINTARDIDDILALEKQCVKDASGKMDIIQTATGELDPEIQRSLRYNQNYPTVYNLPPDDNTKDDYYKIRFGAQPVVLKRGDKYTPYKPDRPGNAWQGFMDFLSNTICISTNMPPSVLLPVDVGGTDIRRDLDTAQRVVEPVQLDLAAEAEEVVLYLMEPDLLDGELSDQPDDWYIAWQFPTKINVDRGQQAIDLQMVQAGLMSWEEFHGRYGDDGDAYEQVIVEEVKRRKERIAAAQFESVEEFVQYLSLDSKLFKNNAKSAPEPAQPDTEDTAHESSQDAAAAGQVQSTALNGAQVTALVQMATEVASKQIPVESAIAIAQASFPLVPKEVIQAVFAPLKNFKQPEPELASISSTAPEQNNSIIKKSRSEANWLASAESLLSAQAYSASRHAEIENTSQAHKSAIQAHSAAQKSHIEIAKEADKAGNKEKALKHYQQAQDHADWISKHELVTAFKK